MGTGGCPKRLARAAFGTSCCHPVGYLEVYSLHSIWLLVAYKGYMAGHSTAMVLDLNSKDIDAPL